MARGDAGSDRLAARANRLYWDSDRSVNQIAEDLEMSKGTLYEVVEPRPAGVACPECGGEMEHTNRTARERGFVTCPSCGLEEEESEVPEGWLEGAGRTGSGAVVVTPEAMRAARKSPRRHALVRVLAGTALIGVAAGIAIATVLRRK